jgi:hypothetical protein
MNRITCASLATAATLLLLMFAIARADEFTGMPSGDSKDLICNPPTSAPPQPPSDEIAFVPMPSWARGVLLPPLPEILKPMGKKSLAASGPTKPVPPPLAPPPDATTTEHTTAGSPTPKPADTPAMITVSPFLQWIQANPQAAAEQARQQAGGYQNPPAPSVNGSNAPGAPATPNGAPTGPAQNSSAANPNPYWLPPLIDAPSVAPTAVGGSAAIYSTPRR